MQGQTTRHSKPAAMESLKLSLLGILIPCVVLLLATSVVVGAKEELATSDDELGTFIVHVQPPEQHVFAVPEDRTAWYRSFLPEDGRLLHAYHHVASGFAARLTQRELDAQPNQVYELLTTHTPQFLGLDMPTPEGVSDGNRSAAGFGDGVIIGVIDTGIFPYHPSFNGDGMPPPPARWKGRCDFNSSACNNKLIGARSFESNPSPLDELGHGTHTSSIAAGAVVPGAQVLGQGGCNASGIAPRAHVAMYKVCGHECTEADMLAGIDAAVGDGCDVLTISLAIRPPAPYYQNSLAVGTFGAVEKGVFVSIGAGNNGPNGSSLSNDAPWMLTVAASTVDRSFVAQVRLGSNGLSFDGESVYQPEISADDVFYPVVYAGASSAADDARFCGNGSLNGFDVKGKIVVCDQGNGVPRVEKGAEVKRAGGIGMILANQFSQGYSTIADAHVLPASHVSYVAGVAIKNYVNSTANPTAQIIFRGTALGTSPAPAMAFFSSRGPSLYNPGILKPDITGPGVSILAAWPFQVGPPSSSSPVNPGPTFNVASGTSMSTPHLGGVAALIKSKHPDWSPAAIRSAIVTTADPADRSGNPILNEQHLPADFYSTGAGHVDPVNAVDPGLVYDIATADYIGFLCSVYSSRDVSVIARRAVDCSAVTVIPDHGLNYPSISVTVPTAWNYTDGPVVVRLTVKNVGEAPAVYYATVSLPSGVAQVNVMPSSLQFTEANQEQSFTVSVSRGQSGKAEVVQGALLWVSEKHTVRSPLSITFGSS